MLYITRSSLVPGSELFWTDRQTRASEADGPDRRADRTAVASLESRPPCVPWFLAEGSAGSLVPAFCASVGCQFSSPG